MMKQVIFRSSFQSVMLGCAILAAVGCQSTPQQQPVVVPPTYYQTPPKDDAEAIKRLATEIQLSRTTTAEADALQRLHKYETDHNLTYTVQTIRIDTNMPVKAGSVQPFPIRCDVTVFKAQLPLYTFSFIPNDNRNLAILGE